MSESFYESSGERSDLAELTAFRTPSRKLDSLWACFSSSSLQASRTGPFA